MRIAVQFSHEQARAVALEAAVSRIEGPSDTTVDEVLEIATHYYLWIMKGTR